MMLQSLEKGNLTSLAKLPASCFELTVHLEKTLSLQRTAKHSGKILASSLAVLPV